MTTRPVRPRPAASLILLRGAGAGLEVLLGRRLSGARFMPDVYVFPGGRVARGDRRAWPDERWPDERWPDERWPDERWLDERPAAAPLPARLLRAALRETFEETGLLVGHAAPESAAAEAGGARPACPVARAYAALVLHPALDRLVYVGRAITPSSSPMRFDTRFFLADAVHAHGAIGGSGELEDLHWRKLAATAEIRMAKVSRFMLERAAALRAGTADPAAPLYHWVRGEVRIEIER
jgi:8-oxo-dGTP pyrophosphatase MutT (NUDIX family)